MELPTLGKVGEKHPPDLQQGDKGLPAGRCHQNLGEKKAPSLGWEMLGVGDASCCRSHGNAAGRDACCHG